MEEEVTVLREFESPAVFDVGRSEASVGRVAPWNGLLEPAAASGRAWCDPDRTSKVKVNPWTGEVLGVDVRSAPPSLGTPGALSSAPAPDLPRRPPALPTPALVLPAGPRSFGHRAVAVVAAVALAGGATVGVALTLWLTA
jgi:hypothetical protein